MIVYSVDFDVCWVKKGVKSILGYKGFVWCDEEGFVDCVYIIFVNKGESFEFGMMIEGVRV